VISIDITYSNVKNWDFFGKAPPTYTVSAKFIPMKYYKIAYETMHGTDKRTMHSVHGLLFQINVQGYIRTFTLTNLLTVLTTAMVSLAMASTLTDAIMAYCPCLALKDHYNVLKFQPTMDFSDLEERIRVVKEQCKAKGQKYDPSQVKSSSCSDAINKFASEYINSDAANSADRTHISHDTMLNIICTFEQRLNRLDGMDVSNDDACAKVVNEFRDSFQNQDSLVRASP